MAPREEWLCSAAMTELIAMSATVALDRLAAWKIALRAENKSPGTVAVYADGITRYLRWCAEHDRPPMSRAALNQWVTDMLDAGAAPGTARIRQQAVRRFAAWLTAGGELPVDPFPGMKAPRVQPPLVEPLTDAELRALIKTCAVSDTAASVETTLHHRRDEAIIRLMFETAIRSGRTRGSSARRHRHRGPADHDPPWQGRAGESDPDRPGNHRGAAGVSPRT